MKHTLLPLLLLLRASILSAQGYRETVRAAMDALQQDSLHRAETLLRSALKADPATRANAILFQYLGQIQERQGRDSESNEQREP